jgi:hypothetical protein
MKPTAAEIISEYGPFPGLEGVHGVSFDGQRVWFATGDRLNSLDPESGELLGALAIAAHAGTAFGGKHLFQIAEAVIQKRLLATFGDQAASRNLRSSRSNLARPYIWRLRVFSRLICPSVCPLLQSSDTAARTAS